MSESQWLFTLDALDSTPSICSREKELYDRGRGVEFLFRLGASLALSVPWEFAFFYIDIKILRRELLSPGLLRPCVLPLLGFIGSTCVIPWRTFIVKYVLSLALPSPLPFRYNITKKKKERRSFLYFLSDEDWGVRSEVARRCKSIACKSRKQGH